MQDAVVLANTRGKETRVRGLTHAARHAAPGVRAALLVAARQDALGIGSPGYRAEALASIAAEWPVDSRAEVIDEALAAATEEVDTAGANQGGFHALTTLAPLVSDVERRQLLSLVPRIPTDFLRAAAYARVVEYIPDPAERAAFAEEGLRVEAAVAGNSEWIRVSLALERHDCNRDALLDEVARTDEGQVWVFVSRLGAIDPREAQNWLERIRTLPFQTDNARFNALHAVAQHLPDDARRSLVSELAEAARELPYHTWRADAYRKLAPELDAEQLRQALRVLRYVNDSHEVGNALAAYLPDLTPPLREMTRDFIRTRVDASQSLDVLIQALEADREPSLLQQTLGAWQAGASIGGGAYDPRTMCEMIAKLIPWSPPEWREPILQDIVNQCFSVPVPPDTAAYGIAVISPYLLSEDLDRLVDELGRRALHEALHGTIQTIDGTRTGRPELLADTIHAIGPERAQRMLAYADQIPHPGWRLAVHFLLAPHRPGLLEEIAQLDVEEEDPGRNLTRALVWLCERLDGVGRSAVAELAVAAARTVGEAWRAGLLASVLPFLEQPRHAAVVAEARAFDRGYATPELLPYLDPGEARRVARETTVATIAWSPYPANHLAETLVPWDDAILDDLLGACRNLTRAALADRLNALRPLLRSEVAGVVQALIMTSDWWR